MSIDIKYYELEVENAFNLDEIEGDFSKVNRKKIEGNIPVSKRGYFDVEGKTLISKLHKDKALKQYKASKKYSTTKVSSTEYGFTDIFNELEKTGFTMYSKDKIMLASIDKDLAGVLSYIVGAESLVIRKKLFEKASKFGLSYEELSSIVLNGYNYNIPMSIFFGAHPNLDNFLIYLRNIVDKGPNRVRMDGMEFNIENKCISYLFYLYIYRTSHKLLKICTGRLMSEGFLKDKLSCHSYSFSNVIYRPKKDGIIPNMSLDIAVTIEENYVITLEVDILELGDYCSSRRVIF